MECYSEDEDSDVESILAQLSREYDIKTRRINNTERKGVSQSEYSCDLNGNKIAIPVKSKEKEVVVSDKEIFNPGEGPSNLIPKSFSKEFPSSRSSSNSRSEFSSSESEFLPNKNSSEDSDSDMQTNEGSQEKTVESLTNNENMSPDEENNVDLFGESFVINKHSKLTTTYKREKAKNLRMKGEAYLGYRRPRGSTKIFQDSKKLERKMGPLVTQINVNALRTVIVTNSPKTSDKKIFINIGKK